MQYDLSEDLVQVMVTSVTHRIWEFKQQELANSAWTAATLEMMQKPLLNLRCLCTVSFFGAKAFFGPRIWRFMFVPCLKERSCIFPSLFTIRIQSHSYTCTLCISTCIYIYAYISLFFCVYGLYLLFLAKDFLLCKIQCPSKDCFGHSHLGSSRGFWNPRSFQQLWPDFGGGLLTK